MWKIAPGDDWQGEPDDDDMEDPEIDDPAYRQLCEKARDLMKENPELTFSQAFSICYAVNSSLVDMSKRHHFQKDPKSMDQQPGILAKPNLELAVLDRRNRV